MSKANRESEEEKETLGLPGHEAEQRRYFKVERGGGGHAEVKQLHGEVDDCEWAPPDGPAREEEQAGPQSQGVGAHEQEYAGKGLSVADHPAAPAVAVKNIACKRKRLGGRR